MDIFTYYRKLGAWVSFPHQIENGLGIGATVSSVMKRQESNSNICFQVGNEWTSNNGYKSERMKRKQINELTIVAVITGPFVAYLEADITI